MRSKLPVALALAALSAALCLAGRPALAQAPTVPADAAQTAREIERLRAVLAASPNDGEARLALAFALEQAGDLTAARYHLELALGAELSEAQKARALADLRRIREASTLGSFALTTLSPVRSRTVVDADGTARTVSGDGSYGVGAAASGRLAFGERQRGFVRGLLEAREYGGTMDDFVYGQASVGGVVPLERVAFSVEAGALGSIYQQRHWYSGGLLQAGATYYPEPAITWFGTLLLRRLAYTDLPGASADQAYAFVDRRVARPGSLTWGVGGTLGVSRAEETWRGFRVGELRTSVLREFRRGWIVEGRLAGSLAHYAAVEPGADRQREDAGGLIGMDITWRERTLFGLAPRLSVNYAVVESNLAAYDSRRALVGIGLTSAY